MPPIAKITFDWDEIYHYTVRYGVSDLVSDRHDAVGYFFGALISNLQNLHPEVTDVEIEFKNCDFEQMPNQVFAKTMDVINSCLKERNVRLRALIFDRSFIACINGDWGSVFGTLPAATTALGWKNTFSMDMWDDIARDDPAAALLEQSNFAREMCRNLILMFDAIENRRITNPNARLESLFLNQGAFYNFLGDPIITNIMSPTIQGMPYIVEVFSHLPTTLTELNLECLGFDRANLSILGHILRQVSQRAPGLERLSLYKAYGEMKSFSQQVLGNLPPNLQQLDLGYCFNVNEMGGVTYESFFGGIRRNCPALKQLDLTECNVFNLSGDNWNKMFTQLQRLQVIVARSQNASDMAMVESWSGAEVINRFSTIDVGIMFYSIHDWEQIGIKLLCKMISARGDNEKLQSALENFTLIPLEELSVEPLVNLGLNIFQVSKEDRTTVEVMLLQNILIILHNRSCLSDPRLVEYKHEIQSAIELYKSPLKFTSAGSAAATLSAHTPATHEPPSNKRQKPQ